MKGYPQSLTIGIAARNEENTIQSCLNSVVISINNFPISTEVEIIIVLNGCTDRTEMVITEYINSYSGRMISFYQYKSREGQIHAQRKIWESRNTKDFVIFVDADTIVEKNCLYVLSEAMLSNHDLEIAWAKCMPIRKPTNTREYLYNLPDYCTELRKEQNYFTGRVFAARNFEIPLSEISQSNPYKRLRSYLQLEEGPMIDDVFLSRSILHYKGPKAIKQYENAIVYFNPITVFHDFYLSQRRTALECKRLDILFPKYSKKTKQYYRFKLPLYLKQHQSIRLRTYYMIYASMKYLSRLFSIIGFHFNKHLYYFGVKDKSCNIWPVIRSSKKSFIKKHEL